MTPSTKKEARNLQATGKNKIDNAEANIHLNPDFASEFDYLAEKAKVEFQANIGSLLELHSLLSARLSDATQRGKEGIFLTTGEVEVYQDWLMQTATALDYSEFKRGAAIPRNSPVQCF